MNMFRLLFVFGLFFILCSFGISQNNSQIQTSGTATTQNKCCKDLATVQHCRDGKDGKNGKNGRDGKTGAKGLKGKLGIKGNDGNNGIKGEKTEPGIDSNFTSKRFSSTPGKLACCSNDCSTGIHFFEKVQDLPTKGALAVEQFKIGGNLFLAFANHHGDIHKYNTTSVIYKMEDSTGRFTLYQNLPTRAAYGLEYFSIAAKHFLAVANFNISVTSFQPLDSVIYQWNGSRFVVFQNIPIKGASHFTFFTIEGEKYLAVTNCNENMSSSISVIYKWKNDKFDKFQEIAFECASGCTVFVINNDTFIAFANLASSEQGSSVFKWSGGHFVKLQLLQMFGALYVNSFEISGLTFFAFANLEPSFTTSSLIFMWDGNKFVLFQSIPTRTGIALYAFVISGQAYLGVANYADADSQGYNTMSVVYQNSGAQFNKYQEIPTHGCSDMTSFEYKGHTYLAVANSYNGQHYNINSALYKWV